MAKPAITKRTTKGAALTYSELDTNFQNLQDATVSLTAGSGGTAVTADLNGNITLVAGTGITLTGNNTAKTITIDSSSSLTASDTIEVGQADSDQVVIIANDGSGSQKSLLISAYVSAGLAGSVEMTGGGVTIAGGSSTGHHFISNSPVNLPNFTSAQISGMSPIAGDVVYNTTTNKLQCYNGSTWNDLF
jgi:hypothetical protein